MPMIALLPLWARRMPGTSAVAANAATARPNGPTTDLLEIMLASPDARADVRSQSTEI
jgi:hypothetical protein